MSRTGHFMTAKLLESQFATLEEPIGEPNVIIVDTDNNTIDTEIQQIFSDPNFILNK